jgi:hypothetical protein
MYKKLIIFVFLLILPSLLLCANDRGIEAEKDDDKPVLRIGKQYALLIGINAYKHWLPLRNPVPDAREIGRILTSRYRYSRKNVIELYDKKATKANIIRTFEKLQKKLKQDDSLLILYSGHGHLDNKTNSGFWIPVDSGKDVYKQENWLPNSQVRGLISNIEAKHVLLLVDSCFSGDIIDGTRALDGINDYFINAYSHVSRHVITSGASETVPDKSEFCEQLKRILKQNKMPYLDSLILYNEIRLGMRKTLPIIGSLSGTGHQEGSSFLLFLKEEEIPATLEIVSHQEGIISVDGEVTESIMAGKRSIMEVKAGTHTITMRYDSDNLEEKKVEVHGGEKHTLSFTWEPEQYGYITVKTEKPGTLHIDGVPCGSVDAGVADIGEIEAGNHTISMVYENGIKEEQEVEVVEKKTTEVLFIDPETGGNAGSKNAAAHNRPFMIGISGAFAIPVLYEEDNFLMPFAGGEICGTWDVWKLSLLRFSLMFSGTYSFHPTGKDISYKNNFHLISTCCGPAVFIDMPFDKKICIMAALLGGGGLSILESGFYKKTFYIADPSVTLQLGIYYRISDDLLITGKGQYIILIDGGDVTDWYQELFLSVGIGMDF